MHVPPRAQSGETRASQAAITGSAAGSLGGRDSLPSGLLSWSHAQTKAGLLSSTEGPAHLATPVSESGISLEYLYKLAAKVVDLLQPDADTATVVRQMVLPCTNRARRARFFDMVPAQHTGPPNLYIIHTWTMPFFSMVEQLVQTLAPELMQKHEAAELGAARHTSAFTGVAAGAEEDTGPESPTQGIYVWLDAFAVDQHPVLHSHADIFLVKEVLRACSHGVAVIVDPQMHMLSRTWCQYEIWACVHYRDVAKLKVCLPAEASLDWLAKYEARVRHLDATQSETTKPEDRTHLLSEIRSVVGMKRMQQVLNEALIVAVRTDLRWSSDFKDLATYSALLIKAGEHARVQQVLHHIAEIGDDFKDTEVIYKMFAGKENAQIDEASFTGLLARTGFDPDEAKNIFRQIRPYDKDSIGKEEFVEWWNSNQRKEVKMRNYSAPPVLTTEALAHNLQQMEALLGRKSLPDLAAVFRQAHNKQSLSSSIFQPGASLPACILHGDWESMTNEVLSRLHCQDYKGALLVLHTLLLWNRDCLDQNVHWIQPSEALAKMGAPSIVKTLAQYLELSTNLLQGRATHASLSACLRRFRDKLRNKEVKVGAASARPRGVTVKDVERHAVVRSMINLKYGEGEPIDNTLIAEAELSLGKVLGSHKVTNRSTDQQLDYLNTMVVDYLRSNRAGDLEKKKEERARPPRFRKLDYDKPNQSILLSLGPEAAAFYQQYEEEEARARGHSDEDEDESASEAMELAFKTGTPAPPAVSTPMTRFLRSSSLASTKFDALFNGGGAVATSRSRSSATARLRSSHTGQSGLLADVKKLERASYTGHSTTTVDSHGTSTQRNSYAGQPSSGEMVRFESIKRHISHSGTGPHSEEVPDPVKSRQPQPPASGAPKTAFAGRFDARRVSSSGAINLPRHSSSPGPLVLPKI